METITGKEKEQLVYSDVTGHDEIKREPDERREIIFKYPAPEETRMGVLTIGMSSANIYRELYNDQGDVIITLPPEYRAREEIYDGV